MRGAESGMGIGCLLHKKNPRIGFKGHPKTSGGIDLRHEEDIGQAWLVAEGEAFITDERLYGVCPLHSVRDPGRYLVLGSPHTLRR